MTYTSGSPSVVQPRHTHTVAPSDVDTHGLAAHKHTCSLTHEHRHARVEPSNTHPACGHRHCSHLRMYRGEFLPQEVNCNNNHSSAKPYRFLGNDVVSISGPTLNLSRIQSILQAIYKIRSNATDAEVNILLAFIRQPDWFAMTGLMFARWHYSRYSTHLLVSISIASARIHTNIATRRTT